MSLFARCCLAIWISAAGAIGCAQPYSEGDTLSCSNWFFYDDVEKARFASWMTERAILHAGNELGERPRAVSQQHTAAFKACLRTQQTSLVQSLDLACRWRARRSASRTWPEIERFLDSCAVAYPGG